MCIGTLLAGLACLVRRYGPGRVRWLALGWTLFFYAVFLREPVSRAIWQANPLLNQAMVTRYAMPSVEFLWAVLAALAWDEWAARKLRASMPGIATACMACAALLLALFHRRIGLADGWRGLLIPALTTAWTAAVIAGLTMLLRRQATLPRQLCAGALLTADALAAFLLPIASGLTSWSIDLAPIRFLTGTPGLHRVYPLGDYLPANYGSYFGIAEVKSLYLPNAAIWTGYADRLMPNPLAGFTNLPGEVTNLLAARPILESASVDYVLAARGTDPLEALRDRHFVPVFQDVTTRIYQLPGAAPYFQTAAGGPCALNATSRTVLAAHCLHPATMIRHELFYPGWHARVNGAKATIARGPAVFQQIELPAGDSEIRFSYVPPHAGLIAWLFGAGLLATAALCGRKKLLF